MVVYIPPPWVYTDVIILTLNGNGTLVLYSLTGFVLFLQVPREDVPQEDVLREDAYTMGSY